MHWINSLDATATFSSCQRSAFWSLTFVNIFCSTNYSSWAACMFDAWISEPSLFVIHFCTSRSSSLCANKDLKRDLKLCLTLSCQALQSLQAELQLRRQSADPLASSIKGENALLVGDLQHLHRKCRIILDLCSKDWELQGECSFCCRKYEMDQPGGWRILTILWVPITVPTDRH